MTIYLIGVALNIFVMSVSLAVQDESEYKGADVLVGVFFLSLFSWLVTICLIGLLVGVWIKLKAEKK